MKKYILYSLCALMIPAFATEAMDNGVPESEDIALKEIREIVMEAFQYPPKNENDQAQPQGESTSSSTSTTSTTGTDSLVTVLPTDLLTFLASILDPHAFLSTTATCKTMYKICTNPDLPLTDYFLVEGMLPCIPKPVLVRRIKSDKENGLIRLSGCYCIPAPFLKESFDQNDLEGAFVPHKEQVPSTFTGVILDEHLDGLYPIFKLHLAVYSEQDANEKISTLLNELGQAFIQKTDKHTSLNYLNLRSLYKNLQPFELYNLFQFLIRQPTFSYHCDINHQPVGIIAKELLMKGQEVALISNNLYAFTSKRKAVTKQLIQWCYKHQKEFPMADTLIQVARDFLKDKDLEYKILFKLVSLPTSFVSPDNQYINAKIRIFPQYAKDDQVKGEIKNFADAVHENWGNIQVPYQKKDALLLFMQTGLEGKFKEHFQQFINDPYMIAVNPNDDLLDAMIAHNYQAEANQLIQLILNSPSLLPSIYNPCAFFKHATKVDQAKTLSISKEVIQEGKTRDKLSALFFLAMHEPKAEEVYIMETLGRLNLKDLNAKDTSHLASIYYYLKRDGLFRTSFQIALDKDFQENNPESLEFWKTCGLPITSMAQLKEHDPYKLMELVREMLPIHQS